MAGQVNPRSRVWIVDDSALDAERGRRVLEISYDVQVLSDGSALLERLAAEAAPDVLVLDWVMPGVSGIEVCRFLREGEVDYSRLAILLLTTRSRTNEIVEGLAAGANDYLPKPYADSELLARVDSLMRWNRLLDRAQKAEASVLQLLEHAPDPLVSVNRENLISYVNAEAQRILGHATQELVGRPIAEVLPSLAPEQIAEAALTSRPLDDIEIDGQIFSPSVRSLPRPDETTLTIALRDVTARRQRESRRLDFYSIIAHDLRSPLAAMLTRTDLMLRGHRGVLSTEVIADLRKMDGNMRRLVALINDFLDFARMEEAAHKMARARVDMGELMAAVADEFKPLVDNTRRELRIDGRQGVAIGDRDRLQQVLTNLVANALKFVPADGHIVLQSRQVGAWCEVTVEDDGPGIAPDLLPRLFQRYSRGPSLHTTGGGTGLGLLIVREIVEAHGGTVGVDSTPGLGCRFWFRIPAADPLRVDTPAPEPATPLQP
ncbi:MAG TPA: hybrid sensor histidine kinase/response regulator [Polyangia bacterium]|nr:hybrid sensor histidine kinase/response regulator [Polyangia bacterium]